MIVKKCLKCNKEFEVHKCREKTAKYCSKECHNKSMSAKYIKICKVCESAFKVHWANINQKYCSNKCKGVAMKLKKSVNYKENPSYVAIHMWVTREKQKQDFCSNCNTNLNDLSRLELANISGEYKRDTGDYVWLCPSCHRKFDLRKEGEWNIKSKFGGKKW